jgi:beta-glucosidase
MTEADIDRNIKGNLRMRMRLGEFDPPELVPYGAISGSEVPQLYLSYPGSTVERPIRQLRGFARISLEAGATRTVEFTLKAADVSYWDAVKHAFTVEPGNVELQVGASSADIRLNKIIAAGR